MTTFSKAIEQGFAKHLTKPTSREAVIEAVASVSAGNGYSRPDSSTIPQTDASVFDADVALERCFGKREMLEEMMNFLPTESTGLLSQWVQHSPTGTSLRLVEQPTGSRGPLYI